MAKSEDNKKQDEKSVEKSLNQDDISAIFSKNKKDSAKITSEQSIDKTNISEADNSSFNKESLQKELSGKKAFDQDAVSSLFPSTKNKTPEENSTDSTDADSEDNTLSHKDLLDGKLSSEKAFDQDAVSSLFSKKKNTADSIDSNNIDDEDNSLSNEDRLRKNLSSEKAFDQDAVSSLFANKKNSASQDSSDVSSSDRDSVDITSNSSKPFDQDAVSGLFSQSKNPSSKTTSDKNNEKKNKQKISESTVKEAKENSGGKKSLSQDEIASLFAKPNKGASEKTSDEKTEVSVSSVEIEGSETESEPESKKVLNQSEILSLFANFKKESAKTDKADDDKDQNINESEESPVSGISMVQAAIADQAENLDGVKRKVSQEELDQCYSEIDSYDDFGSIAADAASIDKILDTATLESSALSVSSKNKPVLGIEIGDMSVKLVQSGSGNRIIVMDAVEFSPDLDIEQKDEEVLQAIKSMMNKHAIKIRRAIICFSEKSTHMRMIKLPQLKKYEHQKALAFETKKFVSLNNQDNPILNYLPLQKKSDVQAGVSRSLLLATDRDIVQRGLRIAKQAGLKVIAIDTVSFALRRFFQAAYHVPNSDEITVFVSMNANETLLSFVDKGQLVWAKYVSIGGADFTDIISNTLMVDEKQAEALKRKQWQGDTQARVRESEVHRAMEPIIAQLVSEIRRAIQFYLTQDGNQGTVKRLILSGASSQITDLNRYLTQSLDIPVVRWNLTSYFNISGLDQEVSLFEEQLPRYANCLGLCLWNKNEDPINLLPGFWERLGTNKKTKKIKNQPIKPSINFPEFSFGPIVYIAFGIGLLALLGVGGLTYKNFDELQIQLQEHKNLLQTEENNIIREDINALRSLRSEVVGKRNIIQTQRTNQVKLASVLGKLSSLIGSEVSPVAIDFESNKFKLSGFAPDTDELQSLVHKLEAEAEFEGLNVGIVKKSEQRGKKRIYFELQSEVRMNRQ